MVAAKVQPSLFPIVGAFNLPGEFPTRFLDGMNRLFEELGRCNLEPLRASQERF
jgi:hypothetical protein